MKSVYDFLKKMGYECVDEGNWGYTFSWREGLVHHEITKSQLGFQCSSNAIGHLDSELVTSGKLIHKSFSNALLVIYSRLCVLSSVNLEGKDMQVLNSKLEYERLIRNMMEDMK